jgi:hypothetical protein
MQRLLPSLIQYQGPNQYVDSHKIWHKRPLPNVVEQLCVKGKSAQCQSQLATSFIHLLIHSFCSLSYDRSVASSLCSLSYDRSVASYKASSPQSAI